MSSNNKGKIAAVAMGIICAGAAGFMGIYLPFYSQSTRDGEDARRQLQQARGRIPGGDQNIASPVAGGMWANIEKTKRHHG